MLPRNQRRHAPERGLLAASRSTFARDSMFEIAVDTSSANCATWSSHPAGKGAGTRPPSRPKCARRRRSALRQRNAHPSSRMAAAELGPVDFRVIVDAAGAAGGEAPGRSRLPRARLFVPGGNSVLGRAAGSQDRGGAVRLKPDRADHQRDSHDLAELLGDEHEDLLRRRLTSHELATRRSADCSAASCSTLARDSRFEIAVETSSVNCSDALLRAGRVCLSRGVDHHRAPQPPVNDDRTCRRPARAQLAHDPAKLTARHCRSSLRGRGGRCETPARSSFLPPAEHSCRGKRVLRRASYGQDHRGAIRLEPGDGYMVAFSKRLSSSVTTPNTCSGGACRATTSATRRSADCSAASCSTFARDSRFEIAVETSSANRATRSSLPGGNASARRAPTAIAPQRRPSTTMGPPTPAPAPCSRRIAPIGPWTSAKSSSARGAAGPKHLLDDASFRNRKVGAAASSGRR